MATGVMRLGSIEPVAVAFTLDGDPYEPDTVTLTITPPTGAATVLVYPTATTILHDTVNEYLFDIEFDQTGPWHVEWVGEGTWTDENTHVREYLQTERQTFRVYA